MNTDTNKTDLGAPRPRHREPLADGSKSAYTCEYTIRPRGEEQTRFCGKPATMRGTKGARLFYCEECGTFVRRAGLTVEPINAVPTSK